MNKIYRIIDVNINRVSEGLRVLEDLTRFYYEEPQITEKIRKIRHCVRKTVKDLNPEFLNQRNAENDLGFEISQTTNLDNKTNIKELITANFKRVQEGLRVIEETLKIAGYYEMAKIYETCRYDSYTAEKIYFNTFNRIAKRKLLESNLYCIIAEKYSKGRSNIEIVRQIIEAGVKIIQYRERNKKKLYKYKECEKIRELTRQAGVTFIVNGDIDIAILVQADGVHIDQKDLPVEKVRELTGNEMIIGLSTHSREQAQDAFEKGADYIWAGPLFKTNCKGDIWDPAGLEYLKYIVNNVNIPFVAVGGIREHNVAQVFRLGAKCIAMATEIAGADDIKQKVNNIRAIIRNISDEGELK